MDRAVVIPVLLLFSSCWRAVTAQYENWPSCGNAKVQCHLDTLRYEAEGGPGSCVMQPDYLNGTVPGRREAVRDRSKPIITSIRQSESGDVLIEFNPGETLDKVNLTKGFTLSIDLESTNGVEYSYPLPIVACWYMAFSLDDDITPHDLDQTRLNVTLLYSMFRAGSSYTFSIVAHPWMSRSYYMSLDIKNYDSSLTETPSANTILTFEVGNYSLTLTVRSPWYENVDEDLAMMELFITKEDTEQTTDIYGNQLALREIRENTPYDDQGMITITYENLKPGKYFILGGSYTKRALRYGDKREKFFHTPVIVTGDSIYQYISSDDVHVEQDNIAHTLEVTMPVPPTMFLMSPQFVVTLLDANRSRLLSFVHKGEISSTWNVQTFTIGPSVGSFSIERNLLYSRSYQLIIQPRGLAELCSDVDRPGYCNNNGTCYTCSNFITTFSISQRWDIPVNVMVLKAALIPVVFVLFVVVMVVVFLKCKPRIISKLSKVVIARRFDGKSKYSFGKSFAEIKDLPKLICLAHLGSGPTACLPGTDVPNRGDTEAIGDKLEEILTNYFDKTVLRFDGTNEEKLTEMQPSYILLSLTPDLFDLYQKYRIDSEFICRFGEEHLPLLNLLDALEPKSFAKEEDERKLCDSQCVLDLHRHTLVTLTFGNTTPHGFPDYDGRMNKYKMPDGVNELMCLIDGIPIHEASHPKMDAFRSSSEYRDLQTLINRCKEAEDAQEQRVNSYNKLLRSGWKCENGDSQRRPAVTFSQQSSVADSNYSSEHASDSFSYGSSSFQCSVMS